MKKSTKEFMLTVSSIALGVFVGTYLNHVVTTSWLPKIKAKMSKKETNK